MIDLNNKSPKILVIGDLMIDHYIWGSCDRISPEAPVQVINVISESTVLGGAGNVLNNLKTLGARVDVISVIGDCEFSKELKDLLKDIDIDTTYLFEQKNRINSKKSRIISSQQQVIRFDRESTNEINSVSQKNILKVYKKIVNDYIAKLKTDNVFSGTITTEVTKYTAFYDAEAYHQDYEAKNPNNGYIRNVSVPRLKRFQKKFPELLKKDAH